jgi:voltage-gated potassium channel
MVDNAPVELRRRLVRALGWLALLVVLATLGFHRLASGVSWLDSLYMVVVTLSGVGYSEIVDTSHSPVLRVFNIVVLIGGIAMMLYVLSLVTAFLVEGNFGSLIRRRRMERRIAGFSGHLVICGGGETATFVLDELAKLGSSAVVIDLKAERLAELSDRPTLATLEGDATDVHTLERAGLARASCVVAALPHEKDNLIVTVLVRQSFPDIRIVARHVDPAMADRLTRAGADAVVSPTAIGGLRLASEAVRPHVVSFLDQMLKEQGSPVRIEEIRIPEGSRWSGRALGGLDLRGRFGLTALAVKDNPEAAFRYSPSPEDGVRAGAVLVVLGEVPRIGEARADAAN